MNRGNNRKFRRDIAGMEWFLRPKKMQIDLTNSLNSLKNYSLVMIQIEKVIGEL